MNVFFATTILNDCVAFLVARVPSVMHIVKPNQFVYAALCGSIRAFYKLMAVGVS